MLKAGVVSSNNMRVLPKLPSSDFSFFAALCVAALFRRCRCSQQDKINSEFGNTLQIYSAE